MGSLAWATELAEELIREYGGPVQLVLSIPGQPIPGQPGRTTPASIQKLDVQAYIGAFQVEHAQSFENILMSDKRVLVAGSSLPPKLPIYSNMSIESENHGTYKVVASRILEPNGVDRPLYIFQARR